MGSAPHHHRVEQFIQALDLELEPGNQCFPVLCVFVRSMNLFKPQIDDEQGDHDEGKYTEKKSL